MSLSFERPAGAAGDTKELEYIAALIQTTDSDKDGFLDASIDARDIKYHLMSRYGIQISKEQVRRIILSGLGGGEDEDDCLDLCEVVAALVIPFLRKLVDDKSLEDVSLGSLRDNTSGESALESKSLSFKDAHEEMNGQEGDQTEVFLAQEVSSNNQDSFVTNEEPEKEKKEDKQLSLRDLVPPEEIFETSLKNILAEATGSTKPQPLTKELIRKIFEAFDETALVEDDQLVTEMIAAAEGNGAFENAEDGGVLFDVQTFARALTADVMLYDPSIETRCTTNFVDAFGTTTEFGPVIHDSLDQSDDSFDDNDGQLQDASGKSKKLKLLNEMKDDATSGLSDTVIAETEHGTVRKKFTFSSIDFIVDNQRSKIHTLAVWFGFIAFFARYLYERPNNTTVCDGNSFGCKIGQSIFNWTVLMFLLTIVGVVYFATVGSGNDVYRKSILDIFIGLGGIVIFLILPYYVKFDTPIFSTNIDTTNNGWFAFVHKFYFVVFLVVGAVNGITQILNALRMLYSDERIGNSKVLSWLLAGSNSKDELDFKRAAVFKVDRMLSNAYNLHNIGKDKSKEGTHDLALLNFTKVTDKTEPVGGFLWAWKSFWNGDLKSKEGIWIHTRILTGQIGQVLLLVVTLVFLSTISSNVISLFNEEEEPVCNASFNPENCYAPALNNGTKLGFIGCTDVKLEGNGCGNFLLDLENGAWGGLFNDTCNYIPPLPTTGERVCDSVSAFDGVVAVATGENIQENDCGAALTTCIVYDESDDDKTAVCLLGISTSLYLPYRFTEGCENISPMDGILESRPSQLKTVDDLIGNAATFDEAVEEVTEDIVPKKWMVVLACVLGVIAGFAIGIAIIIYYIPSTISTVLRFRYSVLPSLRDPNFISYRRSLESVTYIVGLMVWGTFSSVFVSGFLVSIGVFLVVWQVTRQFLITIIAVVIGIASTLIIKTIIITILGRVNYAAFYRKKPWLGNVAGVALECWHLGLTSGYILARTIKLIVAASMYIGRIDKPFLGDGVGLIGPVHLDKFPLVYRQTLLAADAHRHPYIERLGLIYLMKIRHGKKFVTQAGSIWRLLFVFSLMPWLRKYRIAEDIDLPEGLVMQQLGVSSDDKYEDIIKQLQKKMNELQEENNTLQKRTDGLQEENDMLRREAEERKNV